MEKRMVPRDSARQVGLVHYFQELSDCSGISRSWIPLLWDSEFRNFSTFLPETPQPLATWQNGVSRVDLSWGYFYPVSDEYVRFGILEFKKPGSLRYDDFENDLQAVAGSRAKIAVSWKYIVRRTECPGKRAVHMMSSSAWLLTAILCGHGKGATGAMDSKPWLPCDGSSGRV